MTTDNKATLLALLKQYHELSIWVLNGTRSLYLRKWSINAVYKRKWSINGR